MKKGVRTFDTSAIIRFKRFGQLRFHYYDCLYIAINTEMETVVFLLFQNKE